MRGQGRSTASSLALAEREAAARGRAQGLGAHYTPHAVVKRVVEATLDPLCRELPPQEALGLRVLDPAVGSGRFLVAALDTLAGAAGCGPLVRRHVAAKCLYGVDVDPLAVDLARRAVGEAAGCSPDELRRNIVVGDSLVTDTASLLGLGAFDAVLTNPPWVSYSGRQAAALSASRRRLLAERFASFRGWPTAHGAFLELAARLLRPDGRAALVLPQQVCHLAGYEATRRAVLAALCRFEPPPEPLGEGRFPGVVQPAAIVYLRRTSGIEACKAGALDAAPDPMALAILEKVRCHPPAPPGTFRDPGVHTGNSADLLLRDAPGSGLAPVREGRCVHPFRLEAPQRWLDLAANPPPGRYFRIRRADAYLGARILVRQTADRPIASRHVEPAYFRNSILACYGVQGLDDAALLGLLNSSLLALYHRRCHPDSRQRAFPQVKVCHLQALPLAQGGDRLVPLVRRIEALAASGEVAELCQARLALDEQVCRLYGLTVREGAWIRDHVGG